MIVLFLFVLIFIRFVSVYDIKDVFWRVFGNENFYSNIEFKIFIEF